MLVCGMMTPADRSALRTNKPGTTEGVWVGMLKAAGDLAPSQAPRIRENICQRFSGNIALITRYLRKTQSILVLYKKRAVQYSLALLNDRGAILVSSFYWA